MVEHARPVVTRTLANVDNFILVLTAKYIRMHVRVGHARMAALVRTLMEEQVTFAHVLPVILVPAVKTIMHALIVRA